MDISEKYIYAIYSNPAIEAGRRVAGKNTEKRLASREVEVSGREVTEHEGRSAGLPGGQRGGSQRERGALLASRMNLLSASRWSSVHAARPTAEYGYS